MEAVRIWAPNARRVEVVRGDARASAEPEPGGWWRGPEISAGDRYAISLDGGPPRPDPRSPWQPDGVHAPSCWIDPCTQASPLPVGFSPRPLRDAVIYELHVGTFSARGTFIAAAEHLDHLVQLGVTHVELMPIAQWAGRHGWGYDGVDLFAPHSAYGGPSGLHYLIRECHRRGLAVLIDVVHNHLGPEGAYLPEFGPYLTSRHRTAWGDAINLDGDGAHEVRRFLIDSALHWLCDCGADGLRLDALHALRDDSARHFVAQLTDEVRAAGERLGRRFTLIGEYDDHDPRAVTPAAEGGWGLDAHWNDDFHHALHALLTGERDGYYGDFAAPGTLARVLRAAYALDGGFSHYRCGPHGKPFGRMPRDRLVAYTQSHDQIGNRGAGERLHQLAGLDRARIAAAVLMTSPFVPMLFQGEEWAASTPFCYFAELESEELRRAVRDGRRAEHAAAGWTGEVPDPTDPATRDASALAWHEVSQPPHAEMLAWYRALITARRECPELRDPDPDSIAVTERPGGLDIQRGPFTLRVNLADARAPAAGGACVLASRPLVGGALPPVSCALFQR
ncbi:MAG TPA: malto-oligosyltrehalose trehalohydrolase [Kofleriaceae bacterium]|jgi:maltooligosyltrehalose trehalohydrolase|nr:malto-oligosyltrehalose trehalohydrolase [Kofleriaceae bacterium]